MKIINTAKPHENARYDRIVELVEGMLFWHRRLAALRPGRARTVLERQVAATDQQIDRLVYELYGLTDAEIAIVEGAE